MDVFLELILLIAAVAWVPAAVEAIGGPLRIFWLPSRGVVRTAVVLLSPVLFVGWGALAGEGALAAAAVLWFGSGDLRAYLATRAVLRNHLLATIAATRSSRYRWWRYLQMYLLSSLADAAQTTKDAADLGATTPPAQEAPPSPTA